MPSVTTFYKKPLLWAGALAMALMSAASVTFASSNEATYVVPKNSNCALDYATFETAIPHVDMKQCPGEGPSDKVFCRAKMGHDELVVFKFGAMGDQCLLQTKLYDEDHFNLVIFDLVIKSDK